MAKWIIHTKAQAKAVREWEANLPQAVREIIQAHGLHSDTLYKLKDPGAGEDEFFIVRVINEDGTVSISPVLPPGAYEGDVIVPCLDIVFRGIKPERLYEVDLPKGLVPVDPSKDKALN